MPMPNVITPEAAIATDAQLDEAVEIANQIELLMSGKRPGGLFIALGMVLGNFAAKQQSQPPRVALSMILANIEDTAEKKMRGVLDGTWDDESASTS